ncbi:hypothetical protein [Actinophytocola sp. NPDC049390]|uniref:hypothetical protein n=1 Tax=Actinophytocola sp. NPDC049390 TaxID=3363894 RepID=UPI00379C5112
MPSWDAWRVDGWTVAWAVWIVAFFVLETVTLVTRSHNELTAHLRPVIQSAPPVWFIGLGLWLWIGQHFLWVGMDWRALFRA